VIVEFMGVGDTTELDGESTLTTASVLGAYADPDGRGPLSVLDPLPGDSAALSVTIINPTGLGITSLTAVAENSANRIAWTTASELNVIHFNVLRASGGCEYEAVNAEPILAQYAGADQGAAYAYLDEAVESGTTYDYVLEVVRPDGGVEHFPLPALTTNWRLSLPLVVGES